MDLPLFLLPVVGIGVAALVLASGAFYAAWKRLRQARRIAQTPTTSAFQAHPGPIEVAGVATASPRAPALGPLSGEPALHVQWRIEKLVKHGKHGKWVTLRRGESTTPFFLKDGSGRILIDGRGAEVDESLDARFHVRSDIFRDPPPRILEMLQKEGIDFENVLGLNHSMRFTERSIREGDTLYALGVARVTEGELRDAARHTVGGTGDRALYLSTRPESSQLRRLRWAAAALFALGVAVLAAGWLLLGAALGS